MEFKHIISREQFIKENLVHHEDGVRWGSLGAGVLPICATTKRILVNHRSEYVLEPNTWGVWGGKIDDHETTPVEAAKRELAEECGYHGHIELIPAYIYKNETGTFVYHNFIGIVDDEFTPELDWESQGYKWLTVQELMQLGNKHFGLVALIKHSMPLIMKYTKMDVQQPQQQPQQ